MILKNDELLDAFYKQEKDKYPELSKEEFKDIVFTPWLFLKREMENGNLETVRLKYFGTFQVYKGRAQRMLINLKERFKYNKIEKKQYIHLKDMLEKFLKNKDNGNS